MFVFSATGACGDREAADGSTGVRNANVAEAWQDDATPYATKPARAAKSAAELDPGAPAPAVPDTRPEADREL